MRTLAFLFILSTTAVAVTACAATTDSAPLRGAAGAPAGEQAHAPGAASALHALFARAWAQSRPPKPATGVAPYKAFWGDPSLAHAHKREAEEKGDLAALKTISTAALSPSDQLSYRLFEYQLQDAIAGDAYSDQAQGLMTQLWGPQLMAGTVKSTHFRTAKDYAQWIRKLRALGPYLAAFTVRLKHAVAAGITQPRVVMERVPAEIAANIADDPEKSPFYAPFKKMPDDIPAAERTKLQTEAQQAIAHIVTPAYKKFLAFFKNEYLPRARAKVGVSNLPDGKAYYRYLVRHYTTTDMTPEQVHALGLKLVAQIRGEMQTLFKKIGFKGDYRDFLNYLRSNPKFYYSDPQQLLEAYRAAAKRVDPNLTKVLSTWLLPRVPYGVRPIPAALAPNTYPAYSVPPARDGSIAGYVGVNLYKPESRPKYAIQVLMCHEGRPGHQLQIPIADELDNLPKFRRFAYYNAFGEGWALYAETLCNEPLGLYDNPYSKFGYLNYQMWRAVRLVVDTGIHYYGWSREKAVKYMQDNTALADQNIATEVDRYIVWPGQALSYMIGERTILSLRKEAKAKLGDRFTLQDFDDAVLGQGSLPMQVLKEVVYRWIARTRAGSPADQLPYAAKPRSLGAAMNANDPTPPAENGGSQPAATPQPGGGSGAGHGSSTTFGFDRASLVNPTTLKVWYGQPFAPCYGKLGKVEVNAGKVAVTVILHRIPPPPHAQPMMCSHMIMLKPVEVKLDRPLGDRKVIDGSTGKAVRLGSAGIP